MANQSTDRISYSYSRKISTEKFGSVDCHVSYATDVQPGEDADAATKRARKHVHRWVDFQMEQEMKAKQERKAARDLETAADEAELDAEIERQTAGKGGKSARAK